MTVESPEELSRRHALILGVAPGLVRSTACRIANKIGRPQDTDDLTQDAWVYLVQAAACVRTDAPLWAVVRVRLRSKLFAAARRSVPLALYEDVGFDVEAVIGSEPEE